MSNKECYWCETLVQALKCLADITRVLQRIHREFQPMINLKNYQIYLDLHHDQNNSYKRLGELDRIFECQSVQFWDLLF